MDSDTSDQENELMNDIKYVLVSTPHEYHADITMHYNYGLKGEDFDPIGMYLKLIIGTIV